MTHKVALSHINAILNLDSTTWQEKKNLLADLLVATSQTAEQTAARQQRMSIPHRDREDNFNFE